MSWWDDIAGSVGGSVGTGGAGGTIGDPLYDTVIRTTSTAYPVSLADANILAGVIGKVGATAAIGNFPQATAGVVGEIRRAGTYQTVPSGFWDQLASKLNAINPSNPASIPATAANAASAAASAGGSSAAAALKFLADNGNLFAKIAIILGMSLGAAQAVAIGGGAFVLIFLLKK